MSIEKILVPDVGGDEVEVIEICFAVGDTLEAEEGIVTVETDKASMDIPAPFAGKLLSLTVNIGDKIKEGDVIAEMESAIPESDTVAAPIEERQVVAVDVAPIVAWRGRDHMQMSNPKLVPRCDQRLNANVDVNSGCVRVHSMRRRPSWSSVPCVGYHAHCHSG
jgi:pyruvate/2-oxoglutarate dehydrogenase complex dihydrolipoamide acyltransferase (E2) component